MEGADIKDIFRKICERENIIGVLPNGTGTFNKDELAVKPLLLKGHRERLRNVLFGCGVENVDILEILEYLLFLCIPFKDTKSIASELLARFDTIVKITEAKTEDLLATKGMTLNAAIFLKSFDSIAKRYLQESGAIAKRDTVDKLLERLKREINIKAESCSFVTVGNQDLILSVNKILEGVDNALTIPIRLIVHKILEAQVWRMILVHNHPSGCVCTSKKDLANTIGLHKILKSLSIELIDHIIIYDEYAFSMKNDRLYKHNWLEQT